MNHCKALKPLLLALSILLTPALTRAAEPIAETPAQRDQRMAWFREARFGMFIHWGLYSALAGEWDGKPVPSAGEWIMETGHLPASGYEKLVPQFNPVKFNARDWVRMAKGAGMKYIVITSKHHEGFGLWDSKLTDWCIKSTPFKRDPLKELADACKKEGITLCFYHSIMDWHHPDYSPRRAWNDVAKGEPNMDRYVDYLKGQLKELLTGYGPLGILWFDGEWEDTWTHQRGVDLYNYVRNLQPSIIVNNRVGKARAGMGGMDKGNERVGDYGTPEQEIPATGFGPGVDWESCMTMNDTWGFKKNDHNWKSSATLIRNLVDCASKGGNYLLNIGPTAEGLFPQASIERLAEVGRWMKANHESIYATTASPFKRLPWGRCTQKSGALVSAFASPKHASLSSATVQNATTLYLHVFDWPVDGKLLVPGLKNQAQKACLLAGPNRKSLPIERTNKGLTISLPPTAPDPVSSTVVLVIQGAPDVEEPGLVQAPDGSALLSASEARLHGAGLRYESGQQRDNLGYWSNPDDWADWEIKITKPGKFELSAEIAAPEPASFEISAGPGKLQAVAPVTGDYGNFKLTRLGILQIPSAGKVTIAVRPIKANWHPINLKALRLKPVP